MNRIPFSIALCLLAAACGSGNAGDEPPTGGEDAGADDAAAGKGGSSGKGGAAGADAAAGGHAGSSGNGGQAGSSGNGGQAGSPGNGGQGGFAGTAGSAAGSGGGADAGPSDCTSDTDCAGDPGGPTCCSGSCRDVKIDPNACGASCTVCPVPAHAIAGCNDGVCAWSCESGFADCNADVSDGCESAAGSCACNPGAETACYDGPQNTKGVGPCTEGKATCLPSGLGWAPCVGQVMPVQEVCGNNIDDDCDGSVDSTPDTDGDGWTACDGDCCETTQQCAHPALVNPGAYEFRGNGVDDDCDPVTADDGALDDCSPTPVFASVTGLELARAMDLCRSTVESAPLSQRTWGLISAELTLADGTTALGAFNNVQVGVLGSYGTAIVPLAGATMAALSSGTARAFGDPGFVHPQNGVIAGQVGNYSGNSQVTAPASFLAPNNDTFPGSCTPCTGALCNQAFDSAMLKLRVRVPTNASGFSYRTRYFTAEYPETGCAQPTDMFVALLQSSAAIPADGNIAIGPSSSPMTVASPLLNVCFPAPGAAPGSCAAGSLDLNGTGMGGWNGSLRDGAGTRWLVNQASVTPGELMELDLAIWDGADHNVDSLVLLDSFRWIDTAPEPGLFAGSPPEPCSQAECASGTCDMNHADCDGDVSNGCEHNVLENGACACTPAATQPCFDAQQSAMNVGPCTAGVRTCNAAGTAWGDCTGQVLPVAEICANGVDEDCDGIIDNVPDDDGDGWTRCNGDCCESYSKCGDARFVNPGALEVPGDGIDNDCDPTTSDTSPAPSCSSASKFSGVTGADLAASMDLCQTTTANPPLPQKKWGLIAASQRFANGALPNAVETTYMQDQQSAVMTAFGTGGVVPKRGSTMAVLSTGKARDAADPGWVSPVGGTNFAQPGVSSNVSIGFPGTAPISTYLNAHGGALLPGQCGSLTCPVGTGANDSIDLRLQVRVPTNVRGFSYSFRFFSSEYQSYQCTTFNDYYLALLTSGAPGIPADHNISFDALANPVSVNNGFFQDCGGNGKNCGTCPFGVSALNGTGFDQVNGGATEWLTTEAPVVPGEAMVLDLMIFDVGDHIYDTLVLLDGFKWITTPVTVGTHM